MVAVVGPGYSGFPLPCWLPAVIGVCGVVVLAGCTSTMIHRVRPGETLWQISRCYGVPVQRIARANGLHDPDSIAAGQELRIPSGERRFVASCSKGLTGRRSPQGMPTQVARRWRGRLRWPVEEGFVTSAFGPRHGLDHHGIDISGEPGTPVRAAYDGYVLFAGLLRGYGYTVVLEHEEGLVTLYAHNERNLVREGEHVRRGQQIARLGQSGRATGPNLHFEVRHENVAIDPLLLLPDRPVAAPKRFFPWGG